MLTNNSVNTVLNKLLEVQLLMEKQGLLAMAEETQILRDVYQVIALEELESKNIVVKMEDYRNV